MQFDIGFLNNLGRRLLLTWFNFNLEMDASIMKCGVSYLSIPVLPLKFGNRHVISSHTLLGMWLLIHAGI